MVRVETVIVSVPLFHLSVYCVFQSGVQTLCITLLLGLSSDTDHHVRAAAIRALGCCVLYPCLREVSWPLSNINVTCAIIS